MRAYELQQTKGLDTYEANLALDLPADRRDFGDADAILADLRVASVQLLTNNPHKARQLSAAVESVCALPAGPTSPQSHGYLETKRQFEEHHWRQLEQEAHRQQDARFQVIAAQRNATPVVTAVDTVAHELYMERALVLAQRGAVTAAPNPMVGCVLVKDGRIIGQGYHHRAGEPHAEVMALRDAADRSTDTSGDDVKGCTAYVTLEPCNHTGRTGPCTRALIAAGVARVVVAVGDPDERVASTGLATLRQAGIQVITGVLEARVRTAMRAYLHARTLKRPYVCVKVAASLDGRIACEDGSSQWITQRAARNHGHKLRAHSQAILVGTGTALRDQPSLTARVEIAPEDQGLEENLRFTERRAAPLLRCFLDATGKVTSGPLLDTSLAPTGWCF